MNLSKSEYQVFVPGRVCLFGEHSDWAGGDEKKINPSISPGRTLVVGTNQGLHASCKHHPSNFIVTSKDETNTTHGPYTIPMTPKALITAARDPTNFFRYACGVAYHILINYRVSGLEINNHLTDLPLGKGLSSSAAFCVLVARAFSRVFGLKLTTRGEMDCAYVGERLTPSKCGRMDQACAFGSRPVLMEYDEDFLSVHPISIPSPIHLLIIDLCANPPKDTTTILAALQGCYRTDTPTPSELLVRTTLGEMNLNITARAITAMEKGDSELLGQLMAEAQAVFDACGIPVCPNQLTAPLLHSVLNNDYLNTVTYGGKGVGSQGDGCAQFVCKTYKAQVEAAKYVTEQLHMVAIPLTIQAATTVRRAVIPAAGFSASLFPSTKVVTPPLFPVVDVDGVAKPAILIVIDELCRNGFDRIVVVVQEADEAHYHRLFKEPLSPQNYHRLTEEQQQTAKRIMEVGERVDIVVQGAQEGFSHAILCAKKFIGDERFMVVLGDHIYRSKAKNGLSCVQQMIEASKQLCTNKESLLGLTTTRLKDVGSFGTVSGSWIPVPENNEEATISGGVTGGVTEGEMGEQRGGSNSITVNHFIEKPSVEEAKSMLSMTGLSTKETYLTIFGLYVINDPATLWEIMESQIKNNLRDSSGSFSFTDTLNELRKKSGLKGYLLDGTRIDIGSLPHVIPNLGGGLTHSVE